MASKDLRPDFGFTEKWQPVEKPSTVGETLGAQFKLGLMSSETLSLGRFIESKLSSQENDIISAEQANELFPVDTPFFEPISARQAATIQAHQDEKKELQNTIRKGQQNFGASFFGFTSSLAGSALDPVGILSGVKLAGVGRSLLNKTLGKSFLQGTVKRRITEQAIEGALGNIATEMAFVIPSQLQEKEDIDAASQLVFAAGAGALFPATVGSIGAAYKKLKGMPLVKIEDAINLTEARILADKNPNLTELELEIISGEKGARLKNEYEGIQTRLSESSQRLNSSTSGAERTAINKEIVSDQQTLVDKGDEIQQWEEFMEDSDSIRENVNSEKNDIYNNPEANEIAARIDDEPEINFQKADEQQLTEFDALPETDRNIFEKINQQYDNAASQLDELVKATHFCVNKG